MDRLLKITLEKEDQERKKIFEQNVFNKTFRERQKLDGEIRVCARGLIK